MQTLKQLHGKKKTIQPAFTTSLLVNVSFEDANEKSNVVLTTVTQQTGILPNRFEKNNFSLKLNHQFTDKLSISSFANFSNQATTGRI
jgi:hypothetical protein